MTVKELIEKLKEFPEDMEVLNCEYLDVDKVYEDVYPYLPNNAPKSLTQFKYVIVS